MNNLSYRKEITSLRAFAIIPVIFYHFDFNIFKSGYLGVDVFFFVFELVFFVLLAVLFFLARAPFKGGAATALIATLLGRFRTWLSEQEFALISTNSPTICSPNDAPISSLNSVRRDASLKRVCMMLELLSLVGIVASNPHFDFCSLEGVWLSVCFKKDNF